MKKRWIVFSGGNGRGAYQAGVLEALFNKGYKFDAAAGISVGAINAAAVALGVIPDLLSLWKTVEEKQFIKRGGIGRFAFKLIAGRLGFRKPTGLHDTRGLRALLEDLFGGLSLEKELYLGRVDIRGAIYEDQVNDKNLVDAVWRSTLIPVVMRADKTKNEVWIDGGVHNVTPLKRVVESATDGDEVWIISTLPQNRNPSAINKRAKKIDAIDILEAVTSYLVDRQFVLDMRSFIDRNKIPGYKHFNIHLIEPSRGLGSGNDYSRSKLDYRYNLGRSDAAEYIKQNEGAIWPR